MFIGSNIEIGTMALRSEQTPGEDPDSDFMVDNENNYLIDDERNFLMAPEA
jgi:hypothetical protein